MDDLHRKLNRKDSSENDCGNSNLCQEDTQTQGAKIYEGEGTMVRDKRKGKMASCHNLNHEEKRLDNLSAAILGAR
ncbi:hypothetical protein CAJAP_07254 [Camponotus japonicus]